MLCPKAWLGSQLLSTQVRDRSKLHTCIPLMWCIKKPLEAVSRNCVVIGSLNRIATRSFSLANRYRESLVGLGAVRVELWDCCINNRLASFRRNTTAGEFGLKASAVCSTHFSTSTNCPWSWRELLNTGLSHVKNDSIGMALMCDDIRLAKITTTPRFDNAKCTF